ncbi:hypothetical protein EJ110_NYTH20442 [Nymphaea thermarum]|nr:hypothetical protein EJ110_NYTH20442 [Nymphaea thermarum]
MLELFLLGCTGVVVFFHGANFLFHYISNHVAVRALRIMNWQFKLVAQEQVVATKKAGREEVEEITIPFDVVVEFILPSAATRDLVRFRSAAAHR